MGSTGYTQEKKTLRQESGAISEPSAPAKPQKSTSEKCRVLRDGADAENVSQRSLRHYHKIIDFLTLSSILRFTPKNESNQRIDHHQEGKILGFEKVKKCLN